MGFAVQGREQPVARPVPLAAEGALDRVERVLVVRIAAEAPGRELLEADVEIANGSEPLAETPERPREPSGALGQVGTEERERGAQAAEGHAHVVKRFAVVPQSRRRLEAREGPPVAAENGVGQPGHRRRPVDRLGTEIGQRRRSKLRGFGHAPREGGRRCERAGLFEGRDESVDAIGARANRHESQTADDAFVARLLRNDAKLVEVEREAEVLTLSAEFVATDLERGDVDQGPRGAERSHSIADRTGNRNPLPRIGRVERLYVLLRPLERSAVTERRQPRRLWGGARGGALTGVAVERSAVTEVLDPKDVPRAQ